MTERPKQSRPNFPHAGSQKMEPQLVTLLFLRGISSIAPRTVLQLQGHPIFAHLRCVSGATGVHQITPRIAQGRYYSALTGRMCIASRIHAKFFLFCTAICSLQRCSHASLSERLRVGNTLHPDGQDLRRSRSKVGRCPLARPRRRSVERTSFAGPSGRLFTCFPCCS